MVSHAVRHEIGAVGAMLYYPDGSVQHAGVKIDGKIVDNDFKGESKEQDDHKFNLLNSIRNPPAVTAAALLVKEILFNKVRGFDSRNFKIEFNDVDLCFKLSEKNKLNLWLPHAELFHHESKTRKNINSNNRYDYINILKKMKISLNK
jgi:GT2 family glycosyltransferase